MARKHCLSITWHALRLRTPCGARGEVAESGAIDHAASLRSLLELCFWAPLLRPRGLRATATWRNSTPKTFPLRRTRTACRWVRDSYLRRTAACPAQRLARGTRDRLCVGPAGGFSSGSASSSACTPRAAPWARLVCSGTFCAAASRGLASAVSLFGAREPYLGV